MTKWSATPYLTFAAAQAAQQAIDNTTYTQIVTYSENGRDKFLLVSAGARLPVDVGDISVTIGEATMNSDIDKVAGTAVDVNSGNKSAGCIRAVIATDDINLAAINTSTAKIPALGQALAAACVPVVLPTAQITTLTPPAAITNFANETGGNLASVKTNTDKIPALGQALAAASVPVVLPAAQITELTAVTLKDVPLIDSKPRFSSTPYGYDVAEGNISGHTPFSKMGFNPDVDATEEDLWAVGGKYVFPTAGMRMEVVSSSANDDGNPLGTGAQTIKIWYLTEAFAEKTEVLTLNGTTPVATVATDIYRVNNFRVLTAGTLGRADGDIDIRHIDNTPIYSRIPAGLTRARNAMYTVPANKSLYITQLTYSIGNSSGGRFGRFSFRANWDDLAGAISTLFYPYSEIGVQDGAFTITYAVPMKFTAGVDIVVSVVGDATNADSQCTVQYRGWLET